MLGCCSTFKNERPGIVLITWVRINSKQPVKLYLISLVELISNAGLNHEYIISHTRKIT